MSHSVQLIIGHAPATDRFLAAWPMARSAALLGGWLAIPVDDALYDAISAAAPDPSPGNDAFDVAPPGLEAALEAATREGGALAYVETDYFGGQGTQSGGAWIDGRNRASATARGHGSINSALQALGVQRSGADDEFDSIGLGRRRHTSDYAPVVADATAPGPAASPPPATTPGGKHLPLWLVLVIIAACVALGFAVAGAGR